MKTKILMAAEVICFALGILPYLIGSFFLWVQDEVFDIRQRLEAKDGK